MSLFSRVRSAAPTPEPAPDSLSAPAQQTPVGDAACKDANCTRHDAVLCSYTDRRGNACRAHFCPDHYRLLNGRVFCRRHFSVARAIAGFDDPLAMAPDFSNRAPSLCEWVGASIDERIETMLRGVRSERAQVTGEPLSLLLEGTPRQRHWERTWQLSDHQGTVVKLVVRVSEANDREIQAMVGRELVSAVTPPWVAQRDCDPASREHFYDSLVQALAFGLARYMELNRQVLSTRFGSAEVAAG